MPGFFDDMQDIRRLLVNMPPFWDGKKCILEMKDRNFQWRQMEWWAFYFELLCMDRLSSVLDMPGDKFESVRWDARGRINWDFKAKAIKTDSNSFVINDKKALDASVNEAGEHGMLVCLCDVEYNDKNRTFQRWREDLQGGKSAYQKNREKRTANSRYRKSAAVPVEILYIRLTPPDLERLGTMKQGRNSNGKPRPEKYSFHLNQCADLIKQIDQIGDPIE